jgi:hypothetical protein
MNHHSSLSNSSARLAGEREDRMRRPFLTARWTDLVLANYRVPPELLLTHVPPGSELDAPDDEPGLPLLSLVAMRFVDTHVYGLPVPTAQSFPEVNLRFYVRRGPMRACVFLREFVPVPLVILGARLLYHQPYSVARLSHDVQVEGESINQCAFATPAPRARRRDPSPGAQRPRDTTFGGPGALLEGTLLGLRPHPAPLHPLRRGVGGGGVRKGVALRRRVVQPRECSNSGREHRQAFLGRAARTAGMEERMKRLLIALLLLFPLLILSACEPQVYSGKIILEGKHALMTVDGDLVMLGGQVTLKEGSQVTGSVYLLSGDLQADGTIHGDVSLMTGTLTLGPHAKEEQASHCRWLRPGGTSNLWSCRCSGSLDEPCS